MTVNEIYEYLDTVIPESLRCDWDNDGLMCCADGNRQVKKVILTLDITESAVDHAIAVGADLIVSHHPMIFRPLRSVTSPKIVKLIRSGIAAVSLHTRLDYVDGGVADCLASALGLTNTERFGDDGLGRLGTLPCEMTPDELNTYVMQVLEAPSLFAVSSGKKCRRVAVVGGDGKEHWMQAYHTGADAFITGTLSYNDLTDASQLPFTAVAAGHYYTERVVCRHLADLLREADPEIVCEYYECAPVKTVIAETAGRNGEKFER